MEVIRKELETGTIMFVPVPDDIYECRLLNGNFLILDRYHGKFSYPKLPQGNWQLLGDSKQLTEDDLSLIGLNLEDFNSLKESLKLGEGKHIVLFEAKK